MKFKLNDEAVDQLVLSILRTQIKVVKKSIKRLDKLTELKPYQQQDICNDKDNLKAMEKVYDYFGGNLDE